MSYHRPDFRTPAPRPPIGQAIEQLSAALRGHPAVTSIYDVRTRCGRNSVEYIAVSLLNGVRPPALPATFKGFKIQTTVGGPIIPYSASGLGSTLVVL